MKSITKHKEFLNYNNDLDSYYESLSTLDLAYLKLDFGPIEAIALPADHDVTASWCGQPKRT